MAFSIRRIGLPLTVLVTGLPLWAAAQSMTDGSGAQTDGSGGVTDPYSVDSTAVDPNAPDPALTATILAKKRRAAALAAASQPASVDLPALPGPSSDDPNGEALPDPNEPLDPNDPTAVVDPAVPRLPNGLKGTISEVTKLRSVIRPAESTKPALPVTGPIPLEYDPETAARNAYNPEGLRVGSFNVNTTVVGAVGYTEQSKSKSAQGFYLRTQGQITAKSDWEINALDITLDGGLKRSFDGDTSLDNSASVKVDGRLDLTEVDKLTGSAGWALKKDDSSTGETGSSTNSDVNILSASLGYERHAGLVGVAIKGAIDRSDYETGTDRNNMAYSSSLRLSLDSGAVLTPFVEGGAFTRIYDKNKDASGYKRSSVGGEVKAGVALSTGLLNGEAAIGYAYEAPEDSRLDAISGLTAETSLAWTVSPLTTVTLKGTTSFEPSQVAKASGSIKRGVDADLAYALEPNITLNIGGGLTYQDYFGIDRTVTTATIRGGAGWKLNQTAELGVTATHSITDSTVAGEDSDESTVEFSVTLRR